MGLDLVAGYLSAWAVRKARRAGKRLDEDADDVVDAGLDRLHDLISATLGRDPAVEKLELEAVAGPVSARTARRVLDAVTEATENNPKFAERLEPLLIALQSLGTTPAAAAGGERSASVGRDAEISADHGSAAAMTMGDVNLGFPATDPTEPGRTPARPGHA
jgi:hypothetical protein